jgi:hypothetical protein
VRSETGGPKRYATITSTHGSKLSKSRSDNSVELAKYDGDIQVVTDISVQVEGGSGRLSVWKSPPSTCGMAGKEHTKGHNSTETLARDASQMV